MALSLVHTEVWPKIFLKVYAKKFSHHLLNLANWPKSCNCDFLGEFEFILGQFEKFELLGKSGIILVQLKFCTFWTNFPEFFQLFSITWHSKNLFILGPKIMLINVVFLGQFFKKNFAPLTIRI